MFLDFFWVVLEFLFSSRFTARKVGAVEGLFCQFEFAVDDIAG